ncbi:MAG: prepilin-type N-terminal cleavage/methylation domain-containing protein [Puniceicoccaceae bacterium]|nr:MAG: prepilin-type N-terminal cleavage/methylation domain-containing protein [Puniceicoccaceae bacterium]
MNRLARCHGEPVARDRQSGFSLIEVLLAVVLGAALLTAATFFIFSMGQLWGRGAEPRLFEQHVRGVTRFLESAIREALPAGEAQGGQQQQQQQAQTNAARVFWHNPPGFTFADDPLLTFEMVNGPGLLAWPDRPLPFVVCSLFLDPRDGLMLLWKSRLEIDFELMEPRRTQISPYVTAITYLYYDAEEAGGGWEERPDPRTGDGAEPVLPTRIRLTFTYENMVRHTELAIAAAPAGVPIY